MFDVGFWELILIFGVGLMILGPERMPRVAAQIGRWVGRARRTANQLRRQLQREVELDEYMNQKRPPPAPHTRSADQSKSTDEASMATDSSDTASTEEIKEHVPVSPQSSGLTDREQGNDEKSAQENRIASPEHVSESEKAAKKPSKNP